MAVAVRQEEELGKVPVTTWSHCYADNWQELIVDAAFAH